MKKKSSSHDSRMLTNNHSFWYDKQIKQKQIEIERKERGLTDLKSLEHRKRFLLNEIQNTISKQNQKQKQSPKIKQRVPNRAVSVSELGRRRNDLEMIHKNMLFDNKGWFEALNDESMGAINRSRVSHLLKKAVFNHHHLISISVDHKTALKEELEDYKSAWKTVFGSKTAAGSGSVVVADTESYEYWKSYIVSVEMSDYAAIVESRQKNPDSELSKKLTSLETQQFIEKQLTDSQVPLETVLDNLKENTMDLASGHYNFLLQHFKSEKRVLNDGSKYEKILENMFTRNVMPDRNTFILLIDEIIKNVNSIDSIHRLNNIVVLMATRFQMNFDSVVIEKLVKGYVACGDPEMARDWVCLCVVSNLYAHSNDKRPINLNKDQFQSKGPLTVFQMTEALLTRCDRYDEGWKNYCGTKFTKNDGSADSSHLWTEQVLLDHLLRKKETKKTGLLRHTVQPTGAMLLEVVAPFVERADSRSLSMVYRLMEVFLQEN
ncbi:unnamed protein product [Ambrosiozyma monospora]|uniref:Unnamed protein product n=1 Tax=Ambrosiozyma monospora TaxID=43982 RepID=A0A9W6Z3M6_AMBMO|nr:unnamed protein product [Ambrosiozyma monospora]